MLRYTAVIGRNGCMELGVLLALIIIGVLRSGAAPLQSIPGNMILLDTVRMYLQKFFEPLLALGCRV